MKILYRFVLCALGLLITSCGSQITGTPTPVTPIVVVVTRVITWTPRPTATPPPTPTPSPSATEGLMVWETPASDVLLNFNPDWSLPPPVKFTERVAQRKFQFMQPTGFKFEDTTTRSLMMDKDQNILISLEFFDHAESVNARAALEIFLDDKSYWATTKPQPYTLAGYSGWIVDIGSPMLENGIGQVIMVDINPQTLFYAIGLAKAEFWDPEGIKVYNDVVNSLIFPGFER